MDEFEQIAHQTVTEEFERLTKAVDAMTAEQRMRYAGKFPPVVWMVAGPSQDLSFAISVN